jgi:probable rRNA maturation factor
MGLSSRVGGQPAGQLALFNRQRTHPVNLRLLRRIIETLLKDLVRVRDYELTVHLVNAAEMSKLNQTHLGHSGSTDVITLDYREPDWPVAGEIIVCLDEADRQAPRFGATWQAELARYVVHGVLHLQGYDDQRAADRLKMKRKEDELLRALEQRFDLRKLRGKFKLS